MIEVVSTEKILEHHSFLAVIARQQRHTINERTSNRTSKALAFRWRFSHQESDILEMIVNSS